MFQIYLRYIQQLNITFVHKLYRLTKRSHIESQFLLGKMCKDLKNLCYQELLPYYILFATFNFKTATGLLFLFFFFFSPYLSLPCFRLRDNIEPCSMCWWS